MLTTVARFRYLQVKSQEDAKTEKTPNLNLGHLVNLVEHAQHRLHHARTEERMVSEEVVQCRTESNGQIVCKQRVSVKLCNSSKVHRLLVNSKLTANT